MELKKLPYDFTICQVTGVEDINLDNEFFFIAKTDEELSLVCKTADAPEKIRLPAMTGGKGFVFRESLIFRLSEYYRKYQVF